MPTACSISPPRCLPQGSHLCPPAFEPGASQEKMVGGQGLLTVESGWWVYQKVPCAVSLHLYVLELCHNKDLQTERLLVGLWDRGA